MSNGVEPADAGLRVATVQAGAVNAMDAGKGKIRGARGDGPWGSDAVQLSRLGSVLNGWESGANAICKQVRAAAAAVREGTYAVDPLQLSRSIIRDSLGA